MIEQEEEYFTIWADLPKPVVEYRLYYDDKGNVKFYTCDKPEGNYIVIDSQTYAAARPDIRVVNGKISTVSSNLVITKLQPHTKSGVSCAFEDISIIADSKTRIKKQKWNLTVKEYG